MHHQAVQLAVRTHDRVLNASHGASRDGETQSVNAMEEGVMDSRRIGRNGRWVVPVVATKRCRREHQRGEGVVRSGANHAS